MATKQTNNKGKQPENTFMVSQLTEIENIDDVDLFLISDYENNKCYSKKLTMKKLLNFIATNPSFISTILDEDSEITKKIDKKIEEAAVQITEINGGNSRED